jgi:hypothetical protein
MTEVVSPVDLKITGSLASRGSWYLTCCTLDMTSVIALFGSKFSRT